MAAEQVSSHAGELRGLGPKGARVGHSVCIVRQVLGSSHRKCFFIRRKILGILFMLYVVCVCLYMYEGF